MSISSKNFLYSIPEELWREIFTRIPVPWIYGADISSEPLRLLRSHQMDAERIKDTQSERVALMLVCRALRPLAEELLYSEVYLPNPGVAIKFSKSAGLDHEGRRSTGWWTRRISIDFRASPWSAEVKAFEAIKSSCPNVVSIHLEQGSWGVRRSIPDGSPLLHGLHTLTVTSNTMRAQDLMEISRNCSHLTHLHFYPSTALYGALEPMKFPHLRRLSISSHVIQEIVEKKIDVSFSLEWLSVRITRASVIPAVHEFCRQHGSAMLGLELYVDVDQSTSRPVILQSGFFDFGANLRTLIIAPSIVLESEEQVAQLKSLEEVLLRVDRFYSMFSASAFGFYFSPNRFPNIQQVTLVLRTVSLYDGPALRDSLGRYLPNIPIGIR